MRLCNCNVHMHERVRTLYVRKCLLVIYRGIISGETNREVAVRLMDLYSMQKWTKTCKTVDDVQQFSSSWKR